MHAPGFVPVAGWESDKDTPLQLTVHVPVPADPGVQLRDRVCVNGSPLQTVLGEGDHVVHPEMARLVQGVPHALGLVPVAVWVSERFVGHAMVHVPVPAVPAVQDRVRVCVKLSPSHTVDGAGDHELQGDTTRFVQGVPQALGLVPVAGRVRVVSVEHV